MRAITDTLARTARRTTLVAVPLLTVASGTAVAQSGGGMMGGGWGLFGGTMGLWGLVWMGLLLALPAWLVYRFLAPNDDAPTADALSVLRERYARGELSDDEFERRRDRLERAD